MEKLIPGDVVRLKSGGPPMTVVHEAEPHQGQLTVVCCWFSTDQDRVNENRFHVKTLDYWPPREDG